MKGGATCEDEDSEGDKTRLETLRRRTMALMRKTAQYASETGILIIILSSGWGVFSLRRVDFSIPYLEVTRNPLRHLYFIILEDHIHKSM